MKVINIDPDILGGTPVFNGTRVPIATVLEYLADGSLAEFFADFPGVTRMQVDELIRQLPAILKSVPPSALIAGQ